MEKLRIGVVGGGHIVKHRHLPVYQKIENAEVSAICDMQEAIAKDVANQFGIDRYYTDFSEMLSKEKLHAVDICTPPKTHVKLGAEAMNAGCHVLAEKPLAMTAEDVDAMYELADKNNVKLCVVHQNLFNPVVEEARNLYKSGALGDLVSVDAAALVRRDNYMCLNSKHWCHRLPGGLNFEVLPHPVYLLQAFLENPVPVCVAAKRLGSYEWIKADEIKVLIEADNGVGLIVSSCNSAYHGDTLNILGTKLGLQVDLWGRTVIKYRPKTEDPKSVGKSNMYLAAQFYKPLASNLSNLFKMAFEGVKVSAHYDFILEFVTSILEDRPMPVSRQEARDNVKIVEDICVMIDHRVSKDQ